MKSFTAKQFNKAPADIYQAARDDGAVEITHDRFKGEFIVLFIDKEEAEKNAMKLVKAWEDDLVNFIDKNKETLNPLPLKMKKPPFGG